MNSILTSIKLLMGLTEEYEVFDPAIIVHINHAFSLLRQLGVSDKSFSIQDKSANWSDYETSSEMLETVKEFVYIQAMLLFDPPSSSFTQEAYKAHLKELEWRLKVDCEDNGGEVIEQG